MIQRAYLILWLSLKISALSDIVILDFIPWECRCSAPFLFLDISRRSTSLLQKKDLKRVLFFDIKEVRYLGLQSPQYSSGLPTD